MWIGRLLWNFWWSILTKFLLCIWEGTLPGWAFFWVVENDLDSCESFSGIQWVHNWCKRMIWWVALTKMTYVVVARSFRVLASGGGVLSWCSESCRLTWLWSSCTTSTRDCSKNKMIGRRTYTAKLMSSNFWHTSCGQFKFWVRSMMLFSNRKSSSKMSLSTRGRCCMSEDSGIEEEKSAHMLSPYQMKQASAYLSVFQVHLVPLSTIICASHFQQNHSLMAIAFKDMRTTSKWMNNSRFMQLIHKCVTLHSQADRAEVKVNDLTREAWFSCWPVHFFVWWSWRWPDRRKAKHSKDLFDSEIVSNQTFIIHGL